MNLFEAKGVILIAVDEKFTLEDKDGAEAAEGSIHRQFLDRFLAEGSEYRDEIKRKVAAKGNNAEVPIVIGDQTFILFAYSKQGEEGDYFDKVKHRYGFIEIENSLSKTLNYCKKEYPIETVYTVPIGTGIQRYRHNSMKKSHRKLSKLRHDELKTHRHEAVGDGGLYESYTVEEAKYRISSLASKIGLKVELVLLEE
ncbi:MAG: DUF6430 domain-containing protein [Oscillospiraceae bacterium]|jgi:hypothetical protein|nr:DUF6430 domain-containing protein [Oscillospiraceae bacterium]